jgi:hypothetical protein
MIADLGMRHYLLTLLIEATWAAPSPQPHTIMFHLGGAIPSWLCRGRCVRGPQRRVRPQTSTRCGRIPADQPTEGQESRRFSRTAVHLELEHETVTSPPSVHICQSRVKSIEVLF